MPRGVMYNVFLVIRTVFFALLLYFHVLMLVFASWNIVAARSQGISTPGASVFLLMSSILIFVLVPVAYLAECICPKARPARVRVECIWTACMSTFQLAATVDATVSGPPVYCQADASWALCASSSLLVNISWLATLIILSYCLTINIAASAHAALLPDIWTTPVCFVPWFRLDAEAPPAASISYIPTLKHTKTASSSTSSSWSEASCVVTKYIAERWDKLSRAERQAEPSGPILFTRGHQSADSNRPTWARQQHIRRGVDQPFGKPPPRRPEPPFVLAPLPRTHSRHAVTSRDAPFVEKRGAQQAVWSRSESIRTWRTPSVFPQGIVNPDQPIPCPKLSEWVCADTVRGSVHRESAAWP